MDSNLYAQVLENLDEYALVIIDTKGLITFGNRAVENLFGYSIQELVGKSFATFYVSAGEDYHDPVNDLDLAHGQAGIVRYEGWKNHKSGKKIWVNTIIKALRNEQHEIIRYSILFQNLTERKKAEDSLRRSEEQYRLLVGNVRDYGIFMLDTKGYIQSWNEGARLIKGYTAEEIIGKHFSTFYTENDLENEKPVWELQFAIQTGQYEEEGWRVRKDGSRFWANVLITSVYNDTNELIGFAKITRDLTERRKSEEALRNSEEKYRLLANTLEQTNQELQHFVYIASHDLQEPLRKIQLFGGILQNKFAGGLTEDGAQLIKRMQGTSLRMQKLIKDLLTFSRLTNEQHSLQSVNLMQIVQGVLSDLELVIQEKGAQIQVNSLPVIEGIEIHLQQLFQNLLSNSLKFSLQDRKPFVEISSYYQKTAPPEISTKKSNWLVIEIKDNGIGFEEKYSDRIFKMFQRLDTKTEYAGNGIGLAICKKVMEWHEGGITVRSIPNEGTTFAVYFPAKTIELVPE
ncbi:MAG: PAS domain S-box protein [Siphonobacter sp.]